MIKMVKMQCPSCGAALTRKGLNTYKCAYCGTEYLIDREVVVTVKEPAKKPAKSTEGNVTAFVVVVACICIVILMAILYGIGNSKPKTHTTKPATQTQTQTQSDKQGFKGDFFRRFVTEAYGKNYDEVTQEELDTLQILRFDGTTVTYAFKGGELKTMEMLDLKDHHYYEAVYFHGLEVLEMPYLSVKENVGQGFENLRELTCGSYPKDFIPYLANPEKLTYLSCDMRDTSSAEGLDKCVNLTGLALRCYSDLTTLPTEMSKLTKLQSLKMRASYVTGLAGLSVMTDMRELELDCWHLKDIGFVENMPNLESFILEQAEVLSVDALADKPLKTLHLQGTSSVKDYSFIENMTDLEELVLTVRYSQTAPSLDNLKKLKVLEVSGYKDVSFLKNMEGLEHLYLYNCDCANFGVVNNLVNLQSLKLKNCDALTDLKVLTGLENLKVVDFSGYDNYGCNIDPLFNIPNLEELNLDFGSGGIDFAKMKENTSIKILHMNHARLRYNIRVEQYGMVTDIYYDEYALADHLDLFELFPNLEELHIQSQKLDSLDFVKCMPKLRVLDITSNNIVDISPLADLPDMELLRCGQNAISKGLELADKFKVDLETEAYSTIDFMNR